jgi:hypothetical protein
MRQFTALGIVCLGLIFGILYFPQNIQSALLPTLTPTLTDSELQDLRLRTFPVALFCDQREANLSDTGPTWLGITIGESTLADVEGQLAEFSDTYRYFEGIDSTHYLLPNYNHATVEIPIGGNFCLYQDRVGVFSVTYLYLDHPNLFDFLALYGEPDAVTWSYNPDATRVVFWFEEGIAAEVVILPDDPDYDPVYGRITHLILFPYQEVEGYENRWPYNRTHNFNPYLAPYEEGLYVEDSIYGPENPFDFEALMATITPEPSVTPEQN